MWEAMWLWRLQLLKLHGMCENMLMQYVSTRCSCDCAEQDRAHQFSDILLEGLAADGGLYVPAEYPQLDQADLEKLRTVFHEYGYAALAAEIVALFAPDIPRADIDALTARAYTPEKFVSSAYPGEIVPATALLCPRDEAEETAGDRNVAPDQAKLWIGHVSNGPTAAFKDMAMQLLGELFEYELKRRKSTLTILGATSGDTGSAAEYALRNRSNVRVVMLTPAGRMTPFQRAQMFSLNDPNIVNVAVDGVFDDCQEIVKAVNADAEFKQRYHIGAVNSINWARLMAQIVYYVALWIQVTASASEQVSFAVPSGNFGNICAGHIARSMGIPIDKLILATNENDVLDQFFHTGMYRVRASAEVAKTSSPSMDIAKASNFERFVYDLLGRDGERVRDLFGKRLQETGEFSLAEYSEFAQIEENYGFISGSSRHEDRLEEIRHTWETYGVLIDPHTADAMHVARLAARGALAPVCAHKIAPVHTPIVVLETALPVKFAHTIHEAIGQVPPVPARFMGIESGLMRVQNVPNDVQAVKDIIRAL